METKVDLNRAKTHAILSIARTCNASELELLIHELAELRANMYPGVPETLEAAIAADAPVLQQDNPSAMFRTLTDGGLRLWIRNLGFGWLAFRFGARDVQTLRELLTNEVSNPTRSQ